MSDLFHCPYFSFFPLGCRLSVPYKTNYTKFCDFKSGSIFLFNVSCMSVLRIYSWKKKFIYTCKNLTYNILFKYFCSPKLNKTLRNQRNTDCQIGLPYWSEKVNWSLGKPAFAPCCLLQVHSKVACTGAHLHFRPYFSYLTMLTLFSCYTGILSRAQTRAVLFSKTEPTNWDTSPYQNAHKNEHPQSPARHRAFADPLSFSLSNRGN